MLSFLSHLQRLRPDAVENREESTLKCVLEHFRPKNSASSLIIARSVSNQQCNTPLSFGLSWRKATQVTFDE